MSEKKIPYKIYLEESEMPREWYKRDAERVVQSPRGHEE